MIEKFDEYLPYIIVGLTFLLANLRARAKDRSRKKAWDEAFVQRHIDYEGEAPRAGDIPPPPWRLPSRARPLKRWFATIRGFGMHRKKDGSEYRHWVRFHPNPGFKIGDKHWSVAKHRARNKEQ